MDALSEKIMELNQNYNNLGAPNITFASSVLPDPMSPATPNISPSLTLKLASLIPTFEVIFETSSILFPFLVSL